MEGFAFTRSVRIQANIFANHPETNQDRKKQKTVKSESQFMAMQAA